MSAALSRRLAALEAIRPKTPHVDLSQLSDAELVENAVRLGVMDEAEARWFLNRRPATEHEAS